MSAAGEGSRDGTSDGKEARPLLGVVLDVSAVPPRPAGAGRYIVELAMALDRSPEVGLRLVTRWDDASRWRTMTKAPVLAWVPPARPARLAYERIVLGRRVQRTMAPNRSGRRTASGLEAETLTVYHGPHYTLPAGLECGRVVTVHDLTFFDHPEWHEASKVRLFQSAIRRAARLADVVVCVSATTAARLQALVDVRGEVVVAEHGVDRLRFCPGPVDVTVLPAGLGSSGEELIVHVGTLEPRKGIVDLVTAFDQLAAIRPSARLVLAGLPGWGAAAVDAAIARSPRRGRIEALGWVADDVVVALMRAASVVAYPSREEGFGLPALEAMAVGAPLVTSAGTAMAEFSGGAAWLAAPGDPTALAAALDAALGSSPDERDRRRSEGIRRASSFTWERTAERHLDAYRRAAREGGRRAAREGGRRPPTTQGERPAGR